MNLLQGPSKTILLESLPRMISGLPKLRGVFWFRDHVYWHKNWVCNSDNISFTLERDPGENKHLIDGVLRESIPVPNYSCSWKGERMHTISTTRRNELLFSYWPGDMLLPGFPFPCATFTITPRFNRLIADLLELLEHLQEPGTADRVDIAAIAIITEAMASARGKDSGMPDDTAIDPRIYRIANLISVSPEEITNFKDLVSSMGFSRSGFYREWQKYSPVSPHRLFQENRLNVAQHLLSATSLSVKEIAAKTGYRSVSMFINDYRGKYGISPGAFRKNPFQQK